MEVLIIVNGIGKRYNIEKPKQCSNKEMREWIFSQLEQQPLKFGNSLRDYVLGRIKYICYIKSKPK